MHAITILGHKTLNFNGDATYFPNSGTSGVKMYTHGWISMCVTATPPVDLQLHPTFWRSQILMRQRISDREK